MTATHRCVICDSTSEVSMFSTDHAPTAEPLCGECRASISSSLRDIMSDDEDIGTSRWLIDPDFQEINYEGEHNLFESVGEGCFHRKARHPV